MKPGPQNALTDIGGLRVGHASDDALKSGVTVVTADRPFTAGVSILGGAPGTRETDLLAPEKTVETVNALVLSGGSAFGLDAASGVVDGLAADDRGFEVGPVRVPIVPAAILFDLLNGGDKAWTENPYRDLGRRAYDRASDTTPIGSAGAGTGAIAGGLKGGIGTASLVLPSGHIVAALVACNSLGQTTTTNGHFWAAPFEIGHEFGGKGPDPAAQPILSTFETKMGGATDGANTTIGIVATDATLSKSECTRLALAGQDGYARATVPSHTLFDGDLVFAAATGAKPTQDEDLIALGHAASLVAARAIARGIYAATDASGDTISTWQATYGT